MFVWEIKEDIHVKCLSLADNICKAPKHSVSLHSFLIFISSLLERHGGKNNCYLTCFVFGVSLVTQVLKNPPAMQETPVRYLGWEDPLEKG